MNRFKIEKYGSLRIVNGQAELFGWSFLLYADSEIIVMDVKNQRILGYTLEEWTTTNSLKRFPIFNDGSRIEHLTFRSSGDDAVINFTPTRTFGQNTLD